MMKHPKQRAISDPDDHIVTTGTAVDQRHIPVHGIASITSTNYDPDDHIVTTGTAVDQRHIHLQYPTLQACTDKDCVTHTSRLISSVSSRLMPNVLSRLMHSVSSFQANTQCLVGTVA